MIEVSVETDIREAMRMLNLLPREAERAAYRAINKIADEVKRDSAKEISQETGISVPKVYQRMYVQGATVGRLMAVVAALPSAKNVGYYDGAAPVQYKGDKGVTVTAWRNRTLYDGTFVKGPPSVPGIKRKVWRRTGPADNQITDKVWGPSIRKSFMRPMVQGRQMAIIRKRWPYYFERYLRAELVKLRGADALRGVANVLPTIQGPTFT